MKRALITGSSGHVGSNLIRKLHEQNYTIRCIDFDEITVHTKDMMLKS